MLSSWTRASATPDRRIAPFAEPLHKWVDEIRTRKRRHVAAARNLLVRPHGAGPAQNCRNFADGQYRVRIAYEKSRTGQQACPSFHGCGFVHHRVPLEIIWL